MVAPSDYRTQFIADFTGQNINPIPIIYQIQIMPNVDFKFIVKPGLSSVVSGYAVIR